MRFQRHAAGLLLAAICLLANACILNVPVSLGPEPRDKLVLETLEEAESFWTTDRVLLVPIDGVLGDAPARGGWLSDPSTLVKVKDILDKAREDDSIRALLLRVNSPGGSVTASDLLYRELRTFREETGKQIVVIFTDVGASGAYYLAMAADEIWAHPTTITGSIGVIAMFPGVSDLSNKIGFQMRIIKSGPWKDMGSLWRRFGDDEREILQGIIDNLYQRFLTVVTEGRPQLGLERVRELADGRIYTSQQALDAGLIDRIGYMNEAIERARELAEIDDAALVTYRAPGGYRGHYYATGTDPEPLARGAGGSAPGASAGGDVNLLNVDLLEGWRDAGGTPFHYLWLP